MPARIITRRTAEVADATVHMPALALVSRVPRTAAEIVGAATLALLFFGSPVVFL